MNIFQLAASLVLNKDDFDKGLNDAEKEASGFGDKLKSGLATAGKIGAAALTATAAGAAALTKSLMSGTKEAADYGDNIDKMSQKLGISAEAYQEWDFIMQHSGASIGSLQASMRTLNNAVVSNSEAFTQLGISQEQVASLSREDLFAEVIKGLQGMEDETQRTALANELLGRGAMELGALLNTSAEDTEAMRQQVHELGGVMSNEAVKAAAQYQDSMQNLKTAADGLKRNLMAEFLPGISTVAQGLTDIFGGNSSEGIAKVKQGVENIVKAIKTALPQFVKAAVEIIKGILSALKDNLPTIVRALVDGLAEIVDAIIDNLPMIVDMVLVVVENIVTALIKNLPLIIKAAVQLFSGIIKAIPQIVSEIIKAMPEIIAAIVEGLLQGLGAIGDAFMQLFGVISDPAERLGKTVSDAIGNQSQKLNEFATALGNVNPQLAEYSRLLSEEGRTLDEIETDMGENKDAITEILALALQEHRGLRDEELESIREYQRQLRILEGEELGIYQSQFQAELIKLSQEGANLSAVDLQQYIVNFDEALQKANEFVDKLYKNKITELNQLKEAGTLTNDEYVKQLNDAKAYYEGLKNENIAYYNEGMAIISANQVDAGQAVQHQWQQLSAAYDTWQEAMGAKFSAFDAASVASHLHTVNVAEQNYVDLINSFDVVSTNAWLRMIATTTSQGQELSDTNKEILATMLEAWGDMSDELKEGVGGDMIRNVVQGMGEHMPSLANASSMTVDQIITALRNRMRVSTNDFVIIGADMADGVTQGMNSRSEALNASARRLARGALNSMRNELDIHSPSRVFQDIIGKNIVLGLAEGLDKYGYYATDAMADLSNSLAATPDTHRIGGSRTDVTTPGYAITQNIYANQLSPIQAFEEAQNAFQMQQFLGNA